MKNKITPEIRFPGYTGDWEQQKLGEVADFFDEKRIPIDSVKRIKGQYPYYGATGIIDYVEDYIFEGEYVLLAEDGANITTRNSPIAYLTEGKFWVNNHAHIMKMKLGSNIYLVQLLEKQNYDKYNSGTAQPKLNGKVVKNIILNFPCKEEQTKIGEFFKHLDNTIALLQQELTTLKQIKQGFLQKMFPKEGQSVPEVRFPGFTGDWEERKISEIGNISAGGDIDKSKLIDGGKFPVLANALTNDGIVGYYNNYKSVAPAVTITGRGDVGHAKARHVNFTAIVRLLVLKPFDDFNVDFLEPAINNTNILVESTGVPQLTAPQFGNYKIYFPTLEEQIKIGNFFKQLDETIALHQRELDTLKETQKAFLQKMFL
ncbi:restriction endonuclease subunit S [Neobacillus sp. OS1-33]|uniref:restriction endonuclease subunit S n=1 Tax=Neobacillus sp. OS1-33 TaxID=3070683 RepID=UPI0027E182C8|nr:restriction endonuclease subunit S [Neobacillus sp. OS1-33]WML26422.1 restriction endonuclease subunit S [Neobacillus sp. OS1-33]